MTKSEAIKDVQNILLAANDDDSFEQTAQRIIEHFEEKKLFPPWRSGIDPYKMEWYDRQEWDPEAIE